jgi:pimeloyl-ACP methyl ester carboxylesterase
MHTSNGGNPVSRHCTGGDRKSRPLYVGLRLVVCIALAAGFFGGRAFAGPPYATVDEEQLQLAVSIRGQPYILETLIVRPSESGGRFPLALIAQGSSAPAFGPRDLHATGLRTWAHDFAHRGWVAAVVLWRGYGRSTGEISDDSGNCEVPRVGRYLNDHADDLQAAIEALATRPEVDPSRGAIIMGLSIGGASALALAGRKAALPIRAVINVSGGLYYDAQPFRPNPACDMFYNDLVIEMARYGGAAAASERVPTLWLYSANDPWFSPALAGRMLTAYRNAGGRAELTMFPPFEEDGHKMFLRETGRRMLLPEIDRFLRKNTLPTWDEGDWEPLLARLGQADQDTVLAYLRTGPTEKALALGPGGTGAYWHSGDASLEAARTGALNSCRERTGGACTIAAENFRPVAPANAE